MWCMLTIWSLWSDKKMKAAWMSQCMSSNKVAFDQTILELNKLNASNVVIFRNNDLFIFIMTVINGITIFNI